MPYSNRKLVIILCAVALYALKATPAKAEDPAKPPVHSLGYFVAASLGLVRTPLEADMSKSPQMSLSLLGGYPSGSSLGGSSLGVEGGRLALRRMSPGAGNDDLGRGTSTSVNTRTTTR
jgi:hypothetical protein